MERKGQEEIVGFVVIVILVAVVFVIFLGISLRSPNKSDGKSEVVYHFLESSMEQTTNCRINERNEFLKLDELLKECHSSNTECSQGVRACEILNQTLNELLDSSWNYGVDYPLKGYSFNAIYNLNRTSQQTTEEFLSLKKGDCIGEVVGNSYLVPEYPGSISVEMRLCY